MAMYYFHLEDDETIVDSDGTDLVNIAAARQHAVAVARELTANSAGFLDPKRPSLKRSPAGQCCCI